MHVGNAYIKNRAYIRNRTVARLLAVPAAFVFATVGVLIATQPAHAAAPAKPAPSGQLRKTAPPPAGAKVGVRADAVSPGITPTAKRTYHLAPGQTWSCYSGNLCTEVWDYSAGAWKIFDLYYCNLYHLSNWEDWGEFLNAQTAPAVTTFYGQNYQKIPPSPFDTNTIYGALNWSPVWHIRNC